MAVIVADLREQHGALPFLGALIDENNRINTKLSLTAGGGNLRFIKKQLTIGDYCILMPASNKPLQMVAIFERKTWKDLSASLKDERMRSQQERLLALKKKTGCHVIYIIEGPMSYNPDTTIGNIPFKNLHAKLRHNVLRGLPFVQTRDAPNTARLLVNYARDFMKVPTLIPPIMTYESELRALQSKWGVESNEMWQQINMLLETETKQLEKPNESKQLEGGTILPAELSERIQHTDKDIISRMWDTIEGISIRSIPALMEKYNIFSIMTISPERVPDFRATLADLNPTGNMKLGAKRAAAICVLAGTNVEKLKKVSASLLACIPGVSLQTAQTILDKHTLREICSGQVSEDMLADIKKQNGARIGPKLAGRIITLLLSS